MKFTLVFLVLLSFLQAAPNRIVIGTFSSKENAENAEIKLLDFIKQDKSFSIFISSNNLKTNVRPLNNFFITSIEPFDDEVMQQFTLNKLRSAYDGTYILPITTIDKNTINKKEKPTPIKRTEIIDTFEEVTIKDPVIVESLPIEEVEIKTEIIEQVSTDNKDIEIKEQDIIIETAKTEITKQDISENKKESSMMGDFIIFMVGLLAIAGAIAAYLTFINRKKGKLKDLSPIIEADAYDDLPQDSSTTEEKLNTSEFEIILNPDSKIETTAEIPTEIQKEVEEIPKESPKFEDFAGKEEGSFGVIETAPKKEEKPTRTRTKKREVPPHAKITKQNFQEFAGMRILVAEDNLINQKVITGLLADTGIEIVIADDGKEALDILKKDDNFTLVLMDAHMPRIDGFEATRQIRANPNYEHILVVALSGDTALDDINKMKAAGMEEHLAKPLRMDALYDVFYAYVDLDNNTKNDEFVEVVMTKELSGDEGLAICGGDEEFYKEILNEFLSTYTSSASKIQNYLESNEMQKADKLLLDIVGITSNIGAKNLNKIAIDLKDALEDTEEKSYLTLADEYEKYLQYLLRDIKDYIK